MQSTSPRLRRYAAAGAGAALLGSTLVVAGAGQANAYDEFKQLSAPSKVQSGQKFTLKCQLSKGDGWKGWRGQPAKVRGKTVPVNASRPIGARGDCSMHLMLFARGTQKIRVVTIGGNNELRSKWLTIKVV